MAHNNSKFVLVLFLVLALALPSITEAARGEGTATIDGGANVTVSQATSHVFTIVLTVGASGITADAENPTFTIPAGFTAPNATPVANAGLVNADGKWSVIGGGTCLVDSPSVGLTAASGQVITVDVTTACTVGPGGTITITYQGQSAATMSATPVDVGVNDVISAQAVKSISLAPNSATLPTITVTAIDITAPTVTVTMDDDALNIGDTSLVTFTFSETPVGFTTADVTVANGSIGAIDTSNPLVQTATYTPTNGIEDATNIITVGTAWTDAALNAGVGDDSPNYTIDTLAPFVTVTMNDAVLTIGETVLVTFTFSEAPTGFTVADVTGFPNGVLSGFTVTGSPLIYTATFTPNTSVNDATNIITVGTAWTDAALNAGVGDDSPNYTIYTISSSSGNINNTITVFKQVINDNGGTATYNDFPLFINGNPVSSGQTVFLVPGIYNITETNSANYTRTFAGDCNVSGQINHGGIGTHNDICTIINNDIGPEVALIPPLIHIIKIPSPLVLPLGPGLVTYNYSVTNVGIVPMTNIIITDNKCSPVNYVSGDINLDSKLDINEVWNYRCAMNLGQTTTNTASATGIANGLIATDATDAAVVVGSTLPPPLIDLIKIPTPLFLGVGGGAVTYTYFVTNPGTAPLSNVTITDDKCTGLPGRVLGHPGDLNKNDLLESNETWTFACQSNLTKTTTNTGTAKGSANGLTVTHSFSATVVVSSFPKLPNTGFPPAQKYEFIKNIIKIFHSYY